VVCHSLASLLWIHLAHRSNRRLADRVLLVAPPSEAAVLAEAAEFAPAPLDPVSIAGAARHTRLVCAASKELERRVQGSVESALGEIEERLSATMRGGVGGGMARRADTGARRPATERSALRPEGRRDGQVHLG
jgi:Serine hydrolase